MSPLSWQHSILPSIFVRIFGLMLFPVTHLFSNVDPAVYPWSLAGIYPAVSTKGSILRETVSKGLQITLSGVYPVLTICVYHCASL